MKTTFELPDALFQRLREHAARNKTTIKAVMHAALRRYLQGGGSGRARRFKLRDFSFRGKGLTPEFKNASWSDIMEVIYAGRGGVDERKK